MPSILIVDDEPGVRSSLGGVLRDEGYEVDAVDTVVLACTHFPLVQDELATAAPRALMFVDGKEGIARRVAHLTRDQAWLPTPSEGIAVFTGLFVEALRPALARYGLTQIEAL